MAEEQLDCARGRACREFGGVGRWATLFIRLFEHACLMTIGNQAVWLTKFLDP